LSSLHTYEISTIFDTPIGALWCLLGPEPDLEPVAGIQREYLTNGPLIYAAGDCHFGCAAAGILRGILRAEAMPVWGGGAS